jgi:hypothetical protein
MTDAMKIEELTDLLKDVINSLEMKQYVVEDPNESHQCEVEADQYYQHMLDILHSEQQ